MMRRRDAVIPASGLPINLDHNATTPPRPEVVEEVARVMREAYGNPGSRHAIGRQARRVLESARERIAAILHAKPGELLFTSGGTESINLAVRGLLSGESGMVASTPGEHPATEECLRALGRNGWRREVIAIDRLGRMRTESLAGLPWPELRLVSVILAHNETGVVQDVAALASLCREHRVSLHLDAVQAVGKIDVDFKSLDAAALSFAAHKFHGPRGVGGLLVRDGAKLTPLLRGGHQEKDTRPGTESVSLAAGMALALDLWHTDRERITRQVTELRDRLQSALISHCAPTVVNGDPLHRLPNTLNISFPGCDGEALLVALDLAGVCCSLGTTCASGSAEPAPVLVAMGLPPEVYRSAVRFSLSRDNTREEIDMAVERIASVVRGLRETGKR